METTASICDRMRSSSAAIWDALLSHRFLRGLADGTLPLENFRFFIEQDNYFLEDYARCLAIGVFKSRNDKELSYFARDLRSVLDAELPNNRLLLGRIIELGAVDGGGSSGPAPATVAYTSYLQMVANRGGPVDLMVALLPCAWSYVEIASALAVDAQSSHPIYAGWISFFSTPDLVAMVDGMRVDLDRTVEAERASEDRRRSLERIFETSSRLERMFWDMAEGMQRWPDLPPTRPKEASSRATGLT